MADKALVVYYSLSSNTQKVAEAIASKAKADIVRLEVENPYPTDFDAVIAKAQEDKKAGVSPKITNTPDLSGYSLIIIGAPNWFGTMAPPLEVFLKENDFTGKTIAPFITHGRGGVMNSEKDVQEWAKGAEFKPIIGISGTGDESTGEKIDEWLKEIGIG